MPRGRRGLILPSFAAVAALSLLVAGCGGGHSPGVASVGSSTTTTAEQAGLVGYASCMRTHGVASFPDPDSAGGIPKSLVVAAAQANPPRFDAADTACSHLIPANGSLGPPQTAQQTRTQVADMLSFATCMRTQGVASFPDPTAQGQLTIEMVQAARIDVHSPIVLRAVHECLPSSHGALTPAKVREALAKAGR
jgi:hypothetical protein